MKAKTYLLVKNIRCQILLLEKSQEFIGIEKEHDKKLQIMI